MGQVLGLSGNRFAAEAMTFRIYYADGSTWQGDPFKAPGRGVVVIAEIDADHGRRMVQGKDYYVFENGRWQEKDQFGLYDYLLDPGPRKVLFGRTVTNEEFAAVCRRANEFAEQSAYHVFERKP